MIVQRTVHKIESMVACQTKRKDYHLTDLSHHHAYVLIGEPGSGKTKAFEVEAERINAHNPIPLKRFLNSTLENHPEWRDGPIFLDGLDQIRTHSRFSNNVIDQIINRLRALGNPKFRISCRSNCWLRFDDIKALSSLINGDQLPVLQLNPLTFEDVKKIVSEYENDPSTFIGRLYENQLNTLLYNPLLLKLLLNSATTATPLETLSDLLENACKVLIRDNTIQPIQHHSSKVMLSEDNLLNATGQLCVMMLLGNKHGWTINDENHLETFSLSTMNSLNSGIYHQALSTSFFQEYTHYYAPKHRLLSEFVAAHYLVNQITSDLSIQRALTLFTDSEGIVYPDLRGLVAWITTLSPPLRSLLINLDPFAVALDSDTSDFSNEHQKDLLNELMMNSYSIRIWPSTLSLQSFHGTRALTYITECTKSPDRSRIRQRLLEHLIYGISYSPTNNHQYAIQSHDEIYTNLLLKIIHDSTWILSIRSAAICGLNDFVVSKPSLIQTLMSLLSDINENKLYDESGELRNVLLDCLYPSELQPSEIWKYLPHAPLKQHLAYNTFFSNIVTKSEKRHIKELLDSLCLQSPDVIHRLDQHQLADITLILLSQGLDFHGATLKISQMYQWFELVEFDQNSAQLIPKYCSYSSLSQDGKKAAVAIRHWLNEFPSIQCQLIEYGLLESESPTEDTSLLLSIGTKFVLQNTLYGFQSWCLSHASEITDSYPKLAEEFEKMSTESNFKQLDRKSPMELEGEGQTEQRGQQNYSGVNDRYNDISYIQQHLIALSEGRCAPAILDRLARLYFQEQNEFFNHTLSDLELYVNGDDKLISAVLSGFRNILSLDDLPDLDQIASLYEKGQRSLYALPFLAGIELEGKNRFISLSESSKRRALGFLFVTDIPNLEHLSIHRYTSEPLVLWYEYVLQNHPDIVAEVMVSIHRSCVRSRKKLPTPYLLKMPYDERYSKVAQLSVFQMFTVFPTRCNRVQIKSLHLVLWSAFVHQLPTRDFQKIVIERLNRKNMDTAQRATWLCAGLHVAPDHTLPLLANFLREKGGTRIHYISDFLNLNTDSNVYIDYQTLGSKDLSQLIEILGRWVNPTTLVKNIDTLKLNEKKSDQPEGLLLHSLYELANRTDSDAINELEPLASHSMLFEWKPTILSAQEEQTSRYRAKKNPYLDLTQIHNALHGGQPTSTADLTVLSVNVLENLADRIGKRESNSWQAYWCFDDRDPISPQPQNICRDILISDLQLLLQPYRINARPEGEYAEDRKANIIISYRNNFSIPIQIALNHQSTVWRSLNEQLVSKFLRDSNCDGYGIYMVFWFGQEYMRVPLPSGCIPEQPNELKNLLLEQICPKAKNHIHIIVVDVSPSQSNDING
ncbi:MAG: hypothetical protein OXE59_00145 [Bacteroidetes bacterium]|nr:hypothetical protein [Bacteroidota bacterium]